MRNSTINLATLAVISLLVVVGWANVRPLTPRPFEAGAWQADSRNGRGYVRCAMADDLVRRMVAERWDVARVERETQAPESAPRTIGLGMRSPIDGSYYMAIDYDAEGKVVSAEVRPS